MSIVHLTRLAVGLRNLGPTVLIAKTLIGAAGVVGFCLVGAAPAGADPDPSGTHPNPFGGLSCDCRETTPDNAALRDAEIHRGIQAGLSAPLRVLPQPSQRSLGRDG